MKKKTLFLFAILFYYSFPCFSHSISFDAYVSETCKNLSLIPGWCTEEKSKKIFEIIHATKPRKCVEIGTFGGSTSYVIARALKYERFGILYCIDAWDTKVATRHLDPASNDYTWWSNIDMNKIKAGFLEMLKKNHLMKRTRIVHKTSTKAVSTFAKKSIDFLYVDGDISSQGCLSDVKLYFPKVKKGGYIILNDSNSHLRCETVAFLMDRCEWLEELSLLNEWIVLKKE
jgi:predicted O-methyltransferase YrrM